MTALQPTVSDAERLAVTRPASAARRTPLASRGEPAVWLTGLALILSVGAIAALLVVVLAGGLVTFWPRPIDLVTLRSGEQFLGVPTRDEAYDAAPAQRERLASALAAGEIDASVLSDDGRPLRRLYRVGNKEVLGQPFRWVDLADVERVENPEHAVMLERLEWGPWIGFPSEIREDGKAVVSGEADAWHALRDRLPAAAERREVILRLQNREIGDVNERIERERLRVRKAEIGAREGKMDEGALERRRAESGARVVELQQEYETLAARLADVQREDDRHRVVVLDSTRERFAPRSQSQPEEPLRLSQIVRAVHPNRLSLGEKLGVYTSRWWEFLSEQPREANTEGGVLPVIFGTVMMTLLLSVAVVPFGVISALYLREYAKQGPIVSAVRIAVNNLAGVPSIVYGVFGLGFFCYTVGRFVDQGPAATMPAPLWSIGVVALVIATALAGFIQSHRRPAPGRAIRPIHRLASAASLLLWLAVAAGFITLLVTTPYFKGFFREKLPQSTFGTKGILWASLTLALMTLPVVIVATEEAISAVPRSLREGSFGCGASKWQTVRRIVLPRATPGIMTGMILAMARGAGEVAPLMIVGAVKLAPDLPVDSHFPYIHLERSFMHLGFHIYDLGFQSQDSEASRPYVWTTTLLLIVVIAVLNLTAITLRARLRRRFVQGAF